MFFVGVIAGVALVIAGIFIWWYRGAELTTGIYSDDELMKNVKPKERCMGSSQKTENS